MTVMMIHSYNDEVEIMIYASYESIIVYRFLQGST